jgi:N-acetylmuramic acid 6-phosphate (MurNAc-6-P) etherase
LASEFENRTFSVMAGGDYALIKSVEGFEDFSAFGRKQLRDLDVRAGDVVFAITEGGETSFVIGTAWEGVASGAKVYFVYNNPDEILCRQVERSREIIEDPRIEKINLTTGPMAIAGSTRMQATSIQLCVLLTILEMVVQELVGGVCRRFQNLAGGRRRSQNPIPRQTRRTAHDPEIAGTARATGPARRAGGIRLSRRSQGELLCRPVRH